MEYPTLTLLGVDFTRAPIAVREALSYTPGEALALLRRTREIQGLREAAVVSTCNRTEFYLAADPGDAPRQWLDLVRDLRPGAAAHDATCRLHWSTGDTAATHLFRVATGLESSILGDAHIASQLREARRVAAEAGTLGPVLSRAFEQAMTVMRRARAETGIARGAASLGSAVAHLVATEAARAGHPLRVLVAGAGTVARECARCLAKRAPGPLVFVNRTSAHAEALARECGGTAAPWASLPSQVAGADVVVAAVDAPGAVLALDESRAGERLPRLVIDLGVPRNVSATPAVRVVTIDGIAAERDAALARRVAAVPAVEAIIAGELTRWQAWVAARPCEGVLKALFVGEAARRETLIAELTARVGAHARPVLETLVRRYATPLLTAHARALRELPVAGADPHRSAAAAPAAAGEMR
ncbi:MAG: glutamyl-tRNA reductase [Vicinamibacterales bacterium]|nr:glutamyl-tRNA reductase [Vicinamibacterales bacterium]